MRMLKKTYSELIRIPTFEERLLYLQTNSKIGESTFGFDRYLNQALYTSDYWLNEVKPKIIIRDNACDLAMKGYEIVGDIYLRDGRKFRKNSRIIVHHIDPITKQDIIDRSDKLFDPENLVCCSIDTHNLIHFGRKDITLSLPIERTKNDTCPWR